MELVLITMQNALLDALRDLSCVMIAFVVSLALLYALFPFYILYSYINISFVQPPWFDKISVTQSSISNSFSITSISGAATMSILVLPVL